MDFHVAKVQVVEELDVVDTTVGDIEMISMKDIFKGDQEVE